MKCELPECARCCFCFPLRYGLLVWAYTKLVFILLLLVNSMGLIISEFKYRGSLMTHNLPMFVITIIFALFFIVDIVFHIIFIISAHTKEYRKMKLFYKEALFGLGLYVFGFFFCLVYILMKYSLFGLILGMVIWCLFFWLIITQSYLIILVRSEVMKLERNTNFQFTNYAIDQQRAKVDTDDVMAVIGEENGDA